MELKEFYSVNAKRASRWLLWRKSALWVSLASGKCLLFRGPGPACYPHCLEKCLPQQRLFSIRWRLGMGRKGPLFALKVSRVPRPAGPRASGARRCQPRPPSTCCSCCGSCWPSCCLATRCSSGRCCWLAGPLTSWC